MPPATRILQSSATISPSGEPTAVDSDVVVILAALLCALICVVGLALVARCAWLRRSLGGAAVSSPPPNKGLKKKVLRALPKTSFDGTVAGFIGRLAECPICLADFVQGDEIRILPQCGHVFHVSCVDTWLGSNSSCPSCRQILVVAAPARCDRCGASSVSCEYAPEGAAPPAAPPPPAVAVENGAKAREDGGGNRFLP